MNDTCVNEVDEEMLLIVEQPDIAEEHWDWSNPPRTLIGYLFEVLLNS